MVVEIIVLSWFSVLFLIIGKWASDGDGDLMLGAVVGLGIPVMASIISLLFGG